MRIILSTLTAMLLPVLCFAQLSDDDCLKCHSVSVENSIHNGLECIECHDGVAGVEHAEELPSAACATCPACATCHDDIAEEYAGSIHGQGYLEGIDEVARCWDCHSGHNVQSPSDTTSLMHPLNQPATCGVCHGKPELAEKYGIPIKNPYELYEKSVHNYQIMQGNYEAASCSDCHGVHNIEDLTDERSSISRRQVPHTCAKCHEAVYNEYSKSVHWKGVEAGLSSSPVCNDCHLEHAVTSHFDPDSPTSPFKIPATCSQCHANERFLNRFGLASFRLESFLDSYHGLALRKGYAEVANCTSCHGVHEIRAETDSLSMVYPANLNETCGNCHPGLGEKVALGKVHVTPQEGSPLVVEWARRIYIWIILFAVAGMVIHNLLDFRMKLVTGARHHKPDPSLEGIIVKRFNGTERTLHWIIMLSFIALAWSGFGLAFPDSAFSAFWTEGVRRVVHRTCGIIMTAGLGIQLLLFFVTKRGKSQLNAMLPRWRDVTDARRMLGYYLGFTKEKPSFGRFTYMEKFEYWALVWGGVLMAITGFGLWYEVETLRILPSWSIELFTVIHLYEAILASLAILIWHFYWVIFDPEVYPGSGVFWHGNMPAHRFVSEHGDEWRRMKEEERKTTDEI